MKFFFILFILVFLTHPIHALPAAQEKPAAPPAQFLGKPEKKGKTATRSETRKVIKDFVDRLSKGKPEKSFEMLHPRAQKKRTKEEWDAYVKDFRREIRKNDGISDVSVETEKRQTYSEDFLFLVYKIIFTNGATRQERCMLFKIEGEWKIDI